MKITNENMRKFYSLIRKATVEIQSMTLFNQLMEIEKKGHQLFEKGEDLWKLEKLETEIWLLESKDSIRR